MKQILTTLRCLDRDVYAPLRSERDQNAGSGCTAEHPDHQARLAAKIAEVQRNIEFRAPSPQRHTHPNCRAVLCLNTGVVYPSMYAAARQTGFDISEISKVVNGRREHVRGYRFALLKDVTDRRVAS